MDAAVGSPIDVTYKFEVAPDAPAFTEDYTVFVHVLDKDRTSLWGDDHQPRTPTTQWKAGSTVEYTRTMFVPKLPYVGPAQIEVGLYSVKSGQRVPLGGENTGDRSIRVATFNMQLPANALFIVFRDGWHDAEVSGEAGWSGSGPGSRAHSRSATQAGRHLYPRYRSTSAGVHRTAEGRGPDR
jgi:hypothetical protein